MPSRVKPYSVKPTGDGRTLKQRYAQFRQAKIDAVEAIEQHDTMMAASARRLLSVPANTQSQPPVNDANLSNTHRAPDLQGDPNEYADPAH